MIWFCWAVAAKAAVAETSREARAVHPPVEITSTSVRPKPSRRRLRRPSATKIFRSDVGQRSALSRQRMLEELRPDTIRQGGGHLERSREAAQECGPRREPWGKSHGKPSSPKGRKKHQRAGGVLSPLRSLRLWNRSRSQGNAYEELY